MDEREEPENLVRFLDIERMTPEQRLSRFTDLLAMASVRLLKKSQTNSCPLPNNNSQNQLDGL